MDARDTIQLLRNDEVAPRSKDGRSELDQLVTELCANAALAREVSGFLPEIIRSARAMPRSFWIALRHMVFAPRLTSVAARQELEALLEGGYLRDPASYPAAVAVESLLGTASPHVTTMTRDDVLRTAPLEAFEQYTKFTSPDSWDRLFSKIAGIDVPLSKLAIVAQRYAQLCASADRPFAPTLAKVISTLPHEKREYVEDKLSRALPAWRDSIASEHELIVSYTQQKHVLGPILFIAELKNEQQERKRRSGELIRELLPELAA